MRRRFRSLSVSLLVAALAALTVSPASAGLLDLTTAERPAGDDTGWTLGGVPCEPIEVPAAAPVSTGSCPGVRPGALVETPVGTCTFNFLFTGNDGRRYMGTAGHCILDESAVGGDAGGEQMWPAGQGPVARDGQGNRVGEFAYAVFNETRDFALVRLDDGVAANPQMCHFGGPTGMNRDLSPAPTVLHHFGNGLAVGSVLPARSALALGLPHPDHVYAEGVVVPGDSGSGIISADGRAVGVIVTTGLHLASIGFPASDAGTMGVTRLGPQLDRAGSVLDISLTLQTAPLR